MIGSSVRIRDDFGELTAAVDRQTIDALNAAAAAGRAVAQERSAGTGSDTEWTIIPAHATHEGFAAGIRARTPTWRIFNKGSLGKRTAALKQPGRRKEFWEVKRGANVYTANRGDVTDKGVAAKNISNPARTAGRRTLLERIRHRIR